MYRLKGEHARVNREYNMSLIMEWTPGRTKAALFNVFHAQRLGQKQP